MLDVQRVVEISAVSALSLLLWKSTAPALLAAVSGGRFRNLPPSVQHTLKSRLVTTAYSSISSVLCIYTLCADKSLNDDRLWGYTRLAESNIILAVGFLLADLCFMAGDARPNYPMLVHHVVSVEGMLVSMTFESGAYFTVFRLLAEISTPPLCLRELVKRLNLGSARARKINDIALMVTFLLCRIVAMVFHYAIAASLIGTESFNRLSSVVFYSWLGAVVVLDCLNIFWFRKIMQGILAMFRMKQNSTNDSFVTKCD